MSAVDVINLISSLASLILAIVAIWLSLHFYDKAKQSEKQTEVNVNEIKTQTKTLTDISSRLLDKYTDYATRPKAADESFLVIAQLLGQHTVGNVGNTSGSPQQLKSYALGVTIAAFHYAGMANLAIQDLLPPERDAIDEANNLPRLLDNTKNDFIILRDALAQEDSAEIGVNDLFSIYQITMGWDGGGLVKGMDELYITQS